MFKNWIMAKRNLFTLFEILFWPSVSFLSVGLLAEFIKLQPRMKAFVLVGVVAMSTVQVCQLDVAYALLYDVWSKALKHGFIAPVSTRHLLIGSLFVGILRGGLVFLTLIAASHIIFDFNFATPGVLPICLFLVGLFLSSAMIGILVSILVLTVGNRAEVAAWSLVSLMLLICGIYYPVSILPSWIIVFAKLMPITYFLEYYRGFYGFEPAFSHVLLKGYATVMAYLFLEVYLMKVSLKRAKRKGILLKLSE